MKILLIAFALGSGSIAATNDNVQNFAKETYHGITESVGHRFAKHGNITEEMQELINYKIDLIQSYDFENMTDEEIIVAKEEIRVLVEQKALELGVELPEEKGFFGRRRGMGFDLTEEMIQMKDYCLELMAEYDFEDMTDEEIEAVKEEIRLLVEEKAAELGIELPDYKGFFGKQGMNIELTEEMLTLKEYAQELIKTYDFENMTKEEMIEAKEEIKLLIEQEANELGIDLPEFNGFTNYNFGGKSYECTKGFGGRMGQNGHKGRYSKR
ncbi:hypothetical protein RJG79_01915 [Mycoplasmatota bacterium WC44]